MKEEVIESIFGCLERIEEKLDKQPVQTEQGKNEDNGNLAEAIVPLVDSVNRTNRNLCVVRDVLKIISDRQKESKKELLDAISSKFEVLSAKDDGALVEEIQALRRSIAEQISKPQHKKVIHDLTTKNMVFSGYRHRPFLLYVPADNQDLRPVKKDRGTGISGLEVSGVTCYTTRQQRQRDMVGAQCLGRQ